MAWLGIGALASGIVLQRLLGGDVVPSKVLEIRPDTLGNLPILHRDGAMMMYGPAVGNTEKKYEIVLNRPVADNLNTCFSLYRPLTEADAEEKFNAFLQRLPDFVGIAKEMNNVNGLQKICDVLIENPSWSIAHLAAHFNCTDLVSHPKIQDLIDYPDYANLMTPFQLAIKTGNLEMVKKMYAVCKLTHLDNNSNSIYHYAATTTKEIINFLVAKNPENINHRNLDGYTPLHLGCLYDKPECVKALLAAGADANIHSMNSGTASNSIAVCRELDTSKLAAKEMKNGGTPLHWSTSRAVLVELIIRGCDVNAVNFEQKTALHVMVEKNSLECVVSLLSHEAEVDIMDKDGNTPLHIAVEKKYLPIVQCLVVFGADFNKKNRAGKTPRHMVGGETSGGKDDNILYILHSVGAKRCPESNKKCPVGCHATGTYNGIPPEQPESPEQREHIHEVLASTTKAKRQQLANNITNFLGGTSSIDSPTHSPPTPVAAPVLVDTSAEQKGRSVMDALLGMFVGKIAAASKTSEPGSPNLIQLDDTQSSSKPGTPKRSPTTSNAPDSVDSEYGRGRLLCLDGGGIRGLLLAQMLLEIELLAQAPVHHMFDWVAGTSTGGILALALGAGKTMKQCLCLYLRIKEQAFVGSRPYASDNLENLLKDNLGAFSVMTDIQHPKIMVTAVMADRKPVDLHIFRNYTSASDILGIVTATQNRRVPPANPDQQLIWQAARATGAAPSYFRAFGQFLDGGLIANNPTLDAMTEIHEYNMALTSVHRKPEAIPVSVVVSLGTGLIPVTELKGIDVFKPEGLWDAAKLAYYGIPAIANLLVDQATAADGRVVDRARAWCSMIGIPYYRLNPQLSEDIAMDEKSDKKLINMLWETKAYMYANRNRVVEMINIVK